MSGPSPIVRVLIFSLPTGTWWIRSSGGRPLGSRKRPSKPTARSRSPRAYSRRCENASTPDSRPSRRSSQVCASVPITTSGSRRVAPARTRAPWAVQRTSHERPMSPSRMQYVASKPGGAPRYRFESERNASTTRSPRRSIPVTLPRNAAGTVPSVPDVTLYDTRTRQIAPFQPSDPDNVGIYACGPTVYARVHVGNARPFVVFSQLKRFLEHEGYGVKFVANITDINDKIYDAAAKAGRPSAELAEEMAGHYIDDTGRIGLGRPDAEPYASEFIEPIVELIQALIDAGHAYASNGDVYFRVRSLPDYGALSRRDVDQMDQGEGVEGADLKEDPLDFALWKAHKPGEDTSWRAPWGEGRPGWHIECSAMAERDLGLEFDIHGGGIDLVFPHHENEIAQTQAARGRPLARIWMHNGMVEMGEAKMAKSVGNIHLLHAALDEYGRDALIVYLGGGHYRQPLAFSEGVLEDAGRGAERVHNFCRRLDAAAPDPEGMDPYVARF